MRRVCVCSDYMQMCYKIVFIEPFSAKAHDEHKRKKEKEQRQTRHKEERRQKKEEKKEEKKKRKKREKISSQNLSSLQSSLFSLNIRLSLKTMMLFSSTSLARSSGATTTLFTPPPPLVSSSSLSRRRVKGIRGKKSEKTKKDALSFSLLLTRSSGCSGGDTSGKRRRKSATKTTAFRRFPSSSSSPRGGEKWRAKRPSSFSDEDDFEDELLYPDRRFKSQDERQAAIDRLSPPKESSKDEDQHGEEKKGELKFVKKVESLRRGTTSSSSSPGNGNDDGGGKNEFGKLSSSLPPERPPRRRTTTRNNVGLSEREKNRAVRREDPDLGPSARERSQMKKMERRQKEADERMERILSIIDDSKFGMAFSMVNESDSTGGAEPAFFALSQKKQLEYLVELQKELDDANIGLIEQLFGLWKWTNDTSDEIIENSSSSYEAEDDDESGGWGKKNYQGGKPEGFLGELSEELRNFLSIDITEVSPNQSKVEVYASPEAILAIVVMLVVSWNFGGWFVSLFVNSDGIPPI